MIFINKLRTALLLYKLEGSIHSFSFSHPVDAALIGFKAAHNTPEISPLTYLLPQYYLFIEVVVAWCPCSAPQSQFILKWTKKLSSVSLRNGFPGSCSWPLTSVEVELELEGAVVEVLEGVEALLPLTFRVKGIIAVIKPLSFLWNQHKRIEVFDNNRGRNSR